MHWSEFQITADRLALGGSEGDWRSAISRCYYAVFHFARDLLLQQGLDIGRSGQSHFNLYTGLLNCGFPAVAALASRIDDLRDSRRWADYDLGKRIGQRHARAAVQEAKALVNDFQTLLTTLPAAQIVAGARQHLQAIGRLGKTP